MQYKKEIVLNQRETQFICSSLNCIINILEKWAISGAGLMK